MSDVKIHTDAPPAYELPKYDLESEKLNVELTKEQILVILRDAFKDVAKNSMETLKVFSDVLAQLANIDLIGQNHQLYKDWLKIYEDFRVVLEDSRDTASDMSARMKTFYQTLVPLAQKNDLPQETKLQIIGKFIIACEISENEAKSTAKRFTDILDRVNIFEKSFGEFASADMTAKEKEIKEINEKITKLNDQIDKLKTEGIVEAVGFGAAIITICVLAVCMAPVGLALAALGGGVIAAGIGANTFEQLRVAKGQLSILRKKLEDIQADQNRIRNTRQQLDKIRTTSLVTIKEKVGFFASAWTAVNSGCKQLETRIKTGQLFVEWPEVFKAELDGTCELYQMLTQCLDSYAAGVVVKV